MINLFLVALASIFVYLKLTATSAVATWSWFWVLSPVIIPYLGLMTIAILLIILATFTDVKVNYRVGKK